MHEGIVSMGLDTNLPLLLLPLPTLPPFGIMKMPRVADGVPGLLGVGVNEDGDDVTLSMEPRLDWRLFNVPPLPVLSSLRLRLCRRVRVPPRSGDAGLLSPEPSVVSPTSLS